MTDYNKLTVANLRQLLKDRGIPSTGLTRKAQIIEKLEEKDAAETTAPAEAEAVAPDAQPKVEVVKGVGDEAASSEKPAESIAGPQTHKIPQVAAIEQPPTLENTTSTDQRAEPTMSAERSVPEQAGETAATTTAASEKGKVNITKSPSPAPVPAHFAQVKLKTPSPAANEQSSIEKPELPTIPEPSADKSDEVSRPNSEDLEEDTKKRKRRSHSPGIPLQDVKAKKPRPGEGVAPDVHLKEDIDVVMEERKPEEEASAEKKVGPEEPKAPAPQQKKKQRGDLFKNILAPTTPGPSANTQPNNRPIVPALHVATRALFIRDLTRPLDPKTFNKGLVSLASTPDPSDPSDLSAPSAPSVPSDPSDPSDPPILEKLFLDTFKTHALVLFASTIAASRVRANIHDTVWPGDEPQRKKLWVDFVPEDKVEGWIKIEEDAIAAEKEFRGTDRAIALKSFEVVYPQSSSPDGGVTAVFQEVGSNAPLNAPKGPKSSLEPRQSAQLAAAPRGQLIPAPTTSADTKRQLNESFQTLDNLFSFTTAKPKLYYKPVSDRTSDRRLEDLELETSRDWRPDDRVRGRGAAGRGLDQKMQFSFDADDKVVQVGGDVGPWADDSFEGGGYGARRGGGGGRGRGGSGYAPRGGFGSGYAPRGGFGYFPRGDRGGGAWRGRGDSWRG